MLLSKLYLVHFRNFAKKEVEFSPYLTLIVGENAKGKTSLLEAIYTSVFGRGYRESREFELISWDEDQGLIETVFTTQEDSSLFQIRLLRKADDRVEKQFYVNKSKKSSMQYKKFQTKAVLFAPEHISIVDGSPSKRRNYFDSVICEFDNHYKKSLRNYENALRRRNKVLENHSSEYQLDMELPFWNNYLLEHGAYITKKRSEYMQYLNDHPQVDGKEFAIEYLKNEFNETRMRKAFEQEKRMRRTVIGPQKDEFLITLKNNREKNVHLYGSRSEQRLGVFWLKLNEIRYFEEVLKKKPLLLLDDVFSELDENNKELVMKVVKSYQTVITTTEDHLEDLADQPETIIQL